MKFPVFCIILTTSIFFHQAVAQSQWDKVYSSEEGFSVVVKNKLYGYIGMNGTVIQPQFIKAKPFSEGRGIVRADKIPGKAYKWGVIDKKGNVVVDFIYESIGEWFPYQGGFVTASLREGTGMIDRFGKVIIPFKYKDVSPFKNDVAIVEGKGFFPPKYGFVNKTGKEIVAPQYDKVENFSDGMAVVGKSVKEMPSFLVQQEGDFLLGYVDMAGKEVIPPSYFFAQDFSEGLALVKKDGKYVFIDKKNNVIFTSKYDASYKSFSNGLCGVRAEKKNVLKYGYIDKKGKLAIPLEYDEITEFNEGGATVKKNGMWEIIDLSGKTIASFSYTYVGPFKEGLARI